jgi:hypothetical protein
MMPRTDRVLVFAVLASGILAGVIENMWLLVLTPVVGGMLVFASRAAIARARERLPHFDALPEDLRDIVEATFDATAPGAAYNLLQSVVKPAAAIFASRDADNDSQRDVAELVQSACSVASDVARLDTALSSGRLEARNDGVLASALAARELHARRLSDAATTLAALLASGLAHNSPASERVSELVSEIRRDASARHAAWVEVDSAIR